MTLASATIPAQSSGQAEIELLSVLTEIESDPTLPILSIQIQERLFQIQASSDDSWTWRDYAIYRRTVRIQVLEAIFRGTFISPNS